MVGHSPSGFFDREQNSWFHQLWQVIQVLKLQSSLRPSHYHHHVWRLVWCSFYEMCWFYARCTFRMLTQRRIFQCVRPFDWFAAIDLKDAYFHVSILPQHRPFSALCSKDKHTSTRPSPSGYPCPVSSTVVWTQGYGVGLGQPHSTSLKGARSVNAEMPGVFPAQEGGSTETFSEAPGAYGILSRGHAAQIASYETASVLASRPGPEMGMAPRHVPGLSHPVLPPHLQPMVGPCFLWAGVPLEQVSRHVVVSTDASTTGWGGPLVQMRWHAAGLGAYANMRFPQWAFSHRPCARSGRTRSKSFWWRLTGPIGLGSQNWWSSRQPLLGKFLWGGISFLREGAPSGNLLGSRWATSSSSKHYHFFQGPVYKTRLQAEVEPVRWLVFSPPGGPP